MSPSPEPLRHCSYLDAAPQPPRSLRASGCERLHELVLIPGFCSSGDDEATRLSPQLHAHMLREPCVGNRTSRADWLLRHALTAQRSPARACATGQRSRQHRNILTWWFDLWQPAVTCCSCVTDSGLRGLMNHVIEGQLISHSAC